jgi:tripartite-type tricarboxylate transporter receptor subunit TctC
MPIYRRAALRASLVGAATLAAPGILRAQDALDQAKIIIGFAPGGTSDVAARHLADKLVPGYARNAMVDNRPGAAGRIGIDALKAAPPDGRTLLLTPASTITIYSAVYKKLSYNPFTDLLPVSLVCTFVHGFAVGPMVPAEVKTLAQYAAWAKANPDKSSCGNPGEGSFPHFLTMLLAKAIGAPIQPIPYRGGVQPLGEMAAGQLASLMLPDGAFLPFTRDGRARVLATSGEKRSPFHPEAATFAEQGVKDIVVTEWFGIFAPPATPAAIVGRASEAVTKGLENKQLAEVYAQTGMVPQGSTPAALAAMIKSDSETWTPRIKSTGFQPIE